MVGKIPGPGRVAELSVNVTEEEKRRATLGQIKILAEEVVRLCENGSSLTHLQAHSLGVQAKMLQRQVDTFLGRTQ